MCKWRNAEGRQEKLQTPSGRDDGPPQAGDVDGCLLAALSLEALARRAGSPSCFPCVINHSCPGVIQYIYIPNDRFDSRE